MTVGYVYSIQGEMGVIYIGSTNGFSWRRANHKYSSSKSNLPMYVFIRENGGWEKFKMDILEEGDFPSRVELHQRERFHIEQLKPLHNKRIPSRTYKEVYSTPEFKKKQNEFKKHQYATNPAYKAYQRSYYQENKDKIKGQVKDWVSKNKERHLQSQKEWREKHPNYMKEYFSKVST